MARTSPAHRRRELLALHRRCAGRVRAVFYWLGADLEVIDAAVLRTFLLAARDGAEDLPERPRPWLGRLAWRVASRPAAIDPDRTHAPRTRVSAPRLPPAADALARFLADHAAAPLVRGLFVLSEFTGLTTPELAAELRNPALESDLRDALVELRAAFTADPGVIALGGARSVLAASLAPFTDDDAWQARHAALLAARLPGGELPPLADLLRRPPAIVALAGLAVAALLLARPDPAAPPLRALAVREPSTAPTPTLRLFPPVPAAMPPAPGPPRQVVRARSPRAPRPPSALEQRAKVAAARDPGAVIVELEMLGAANKSLPQNPHQALAYADQHAKDYPDSQLAGRRAEVRVRALCALKRPAEARAEAQRHPVARVQTALAEACR